MAKVRKKHVTRKRSKKVTAKKSARERKSAKKKVTRKRSPRLPISVAEVKRLAFEYETIADADQQATTRQPLADVLARHDKLMDAWKRGELLRRLRASASVVDTIHEAARDLGFERGQDLRDWLDGDTEARDLWDQTRFVTRKRVRAALITAAEEGNQRAISVVEAYLADDSAAEKVDFFRLTTQQMCELTGKTRQTLHEWVTKHGLARNGDKTFNLKVFIGWYDEFLSRKQGVGGRISPLDPLKAAKAEEKQIQVALLRHQVLDRQEMVVGLCARYQAIIDWFSRTVEEITRMVYGQSHEETRALIIKWFNEGRHQWEAVPEQLQLTDSQAERLCDILMEINPQLSNEVKGNQGV